ncbi:MULTISPECIES: hypothetical protein [unclassified Nocardioides]|uniref:hypothetical protein n=1 Tax=unclassified Nocardioides TaxID=2615069 RepID=UPI0006F4F1EC|nr:MULTISPECIES: hypothetical protein [unclassified Nocardioides]KRA29683.1 hypothetical protein ASD81_22280 [Nocardioides sp. Root614]KRA88141.1 hypothetical protein ASD84_19335 [Nocardioides sp. Root682]
MQHFKNTRRALAALVAGIVAALAASLLIVPPASAASHSGELLLRGPGASAYTRGYAVSLVGKEGATMTYTFQVRNTGTTLAQYRININDWTGAQAQLYDGTLLLKPLASSPDGYYTKPIAPGGNQALTLKIPIPVGTAAVEHYSSVYLYGTDGYVLDSRNLIAEEPAVLTGSTAQDLFVKNGGQLAVGGAGHPAQVMTAPTISGTQVAVFTATLQNSTAASTTIGFQLYDDGCAQVIVKDGTLDVTAAARNGTYQTPSLAKLGKRNLTISVKNVLAGCPRGTVYVYSKLGAGPLQQQSILLANKAA